MRVFFFSVLLYDAVLYVFEVSNNCILSYTNTRTWSSESNFFYQMKIFRLLSLFISKLYCSVSSLFIVLYSIKHAPCLCCKELLKHKLTLIEHVNTQTSSRMAFQPQLQPWIEGASTENHLCLLDHRESKPDTEGGL